MNRKVAVAVFIAALLAAWPNAALAEWKVYYTGEAAKMFGSHGRGNFKTKSQCETYRSARPWFESSKSYCSGFDVPSFQPAKPAPQVQGNAPAAQGPQVQTKAPASGQPDPAEDRKFNEQKGALLRTIRIPDPGDVPQGPSISPSRFVTPDMCRQAEGTGRSLRKRWRACRSGRGPSILPCAEAMREFMPKRWRRCRQCSESLQGCSTWARRQ